MGWRDTVGKFFRRQAAGQAAVAARGASGEATMPHALPNAPMDAGGMGSQYLQLATMLSVDADLLLRFADMENMDDYVETSVALDVYADCSTIADSVRGQVLWGVSKDKVVRDIINDLLDRRLRIEDDIWAAIRTFTKYGNAYAEVITNEKGVLGLNWLPPPTMRRIVDQRGTLIGFVQDPSGEFGFNLTTREDLDRLRSAQGGPAQNGAVFFQPWEVVHWRLRGKQMRALYGFGVLDSARWVWKRLLMLEDSSLTNKLLKAPARFAFYIDTGEIPPREARAAVDEVRRRYKKKRIMDPCLTGETLVSCLDGKVRSMRDLAEAGTDTWVYSFDLSQGKVVPGLARNPRRTGQQVPVYRVLLDNGAVVRATGHHPFLLRDGTYQRCDELKRGDRLMPLYLCREGKKSRTNGYVHVRQPIDGESVSVHSMVARELWPDLVTSCDDAVVHHRDCNRANNDPANLEVLERKDHALEHLETNLGPAREAFVRRIDRDATFRDGISDRLHAWRSRDPDLVRAICSRSGKKAMQERMEKVRPLHDQMMAMIVGAVERDPLISAVELIDMLNADPKFVALYSSMETTAKSMLNYACLYAWLRRMGYSGYRNFKMSVVGSARHRNRSYEGTVPSDGAINHRVVDVQPDGVEDVYNMDVDKYANFALYSGVFVHNSTGKLDFRFNPLEQCLSLETRIPLLNGTTRTLHDLIMDHEAGVQNYVYSMDPETKRVKPGKISWAGVTRRNAQVLRVTLDNCQEVIATPDHQFLMRDGTYKQAQFLEPGDSVMPLYRGIANSGYEYVIHQDHRERGLDKWKSLEPVHRLVAQTFLGDPAGLWVHHLDERKRNNYPENLEMVTPEEHGMRHAGALASRVRRWAQDHPGEIAKRNRAHNSGKHIIAYNRSPKHAADNAIRSEKISLKYPEGLLPELRRLVQENATLKITDAVEAIRTLPVHDEFRALNPNRKRVRFDLYHVRTLIHREGHRNWQGFCAAATENHKVASVEWLTETPDTGCITVDVWHNFALDAGIYVKNSEDFFIPTRGGKESTRIETLAGPDYDDTGVLEYFRKKLYASIRIPPQYLGGTEVTNRAALVQEDVNFARMVQRIQREFVAGLNQVVRVHLAALNIDPDSVRWDLRMPVPSSLFEMQQVEVWNARAGLAAALQPFFTAPWIMANIFHLSDEDALFASEAKANEAEAQALAQASVQADIMRRFPELGPEGALALGAPTTGGMPMLPPGAQPGQVPAEDVKQRVDKALTEMQQTSDRILRSIERTDRTVGRLGQRLRVAK